MNTEESNTISILANELSSERQFVDALTKALFARNTLIKKILDTIETENDSVTLAPGALMQLEHVMGYMGQYDLETLAKELHDIHKQYSARKEQSFSE